jgi:uncharacterized Zn finger protein
MTNYTLEASREWWSQRWLDLLDSYRFKKRLERGRIYARQGNILSIEFQSAKVLARVQGSEPEPYILSLSLEQFSDEQWGYVIETMSQKAIFAAKLLAGEMPQNIEEVFTANGLSLFPFTLSDVHSKCSCPDKANPCKHIAAVYYQLGNRFSEDPFVLFQLRGRSKEQIINDLRLLRQTRDEQKLDVETSNAKSPHPELDFNKSTSENQHHVNIDSFWEYNEPLESTLVVIAPSTSETVLDMLGSIPLAKEEEQIATLTAADVVMKFLETIYKEASQKAVLEAMNVETT